MREQDMASLYQEYARQVYKYLYSLCHDADTAEDLTQETFCRAIGSVDRYNGSCKIYVWLCQIAKHLWYQELEKRNKTKSAEFSDQIPASELAVEEKTILSEEKFQLFRLLHLLNEPMREIMYLRLTGEFSFKEIGEILGRDETWARVNFYRGKQKLHEQKLQEEKLQEPELQKRERQK